mmetsp:Transcript_21873/g.45669  ORF Transcript_21873/g.45669 Transcript_21873/m.45669 type:complete len:205 (-) Transcript_21873:2258-2872(-)
MLGRVDLVVLAGQALHPVLPVIDLLLERLLVSRERRDFALGVLNILLKRFLPGLGLCELLRQHLDLRLVLLVVVPEHVVAFAEQVKLRDLVHQPLVLGIFLGLLPCLFLGPLKLQPSLVEVALHDGRRTPLDCELLLEQLEPVAELVALGAHVGDELPALTQLRQKLLVPVAERAGGDRRRLQPLGRRGVRRDLVVEQGILLLA